MASLALHLKSHHHKPSQTLLKSTPSFTHFFSSSSSDNNNNNNNNNNDDNGEKQYPFSGYFKDIKSKLKQHEQQRQQQSPAFNKPSPFNFTSQDSSTPSKKPESFEEIKKNLSEFRRRSSSDIPPPSSSPQQSNLFQNIHNRTVGNPNSTATNVQGKGGNLSFEAIRESLRQMKGAAGEKGIGNSNMSDKMSLNNYKRSLKLQQPMTMPASGSGAKVIGGSFENLPESVFGKEMREKERKEQGGGGGVGVGGGRGGKSALDIQLLKSYNYDELGDKLRELRPEMKEKKSGEGSWFSLSELNERVKKLKEIEEKQLNDDKISGAVYVDLRRSLRSLKDESDNKSKTASMQGFNMLPSSSLTQSPPKEHLIEKYFHPDNMSAEEKLKLELKKVRDEFKMHESDCGSTRVQIAQLTTEILHLSSVLHKKDKHSRKGLQAKVQQRKKLLKYLRRTDWESYILVLSKLGLRDNPDYKN